jgi:hypothetical protein
MVIPGNFRDIETGETLAPVYRFQDAMQIWHEKPLHKCSQLELWNFSTMLWNVAMKHEVEMQMAKSEAQMAKSEVQKAKAWLTFWIVLNILSSTALFYSLVAK